MVLDLETTGLCSREGARVIEAGAVRLRKGLFVAEFHSLINPQKTLPAEVTRITGIKQVDLLNAPSPERVIPQLLKFIGRDPVIAHHASFESEFLASECQCIGQFPPHIVFHCSLRLSRKKVDDTPNCRLETLARSLNLPAPNGFHRALYDARITAHLWVHLCHLVDAIGD